MPLTVTKQKVLDRFPELDVEPAMTDVVWDTLISDADMEIPVSAWLDQEAADRAGLWLVAHMLLVEKQRQLGGMAAAAQPGQLKSVTVGPVTKEWVTPAEGSNAKSTAPADVQLSRTEYGREYMRLRKLFCRSRS